MLTPARKSRNRASPRLLRHHCLPLQHPLRGCHGQGGTAGIEEGAAQKRFASYECRAPLKYRRWRRGWRSPTPLVRHHLPGRDFARPNRPRPTNCRRPKHCRLPNCKSSAPFRSSTKFCCWRTKRRPSSVVLTKNTIAARKRPKPRWKWRASWPRRLLAPARNLNRNRNLWRLRRLRSGLGLGR